MGIKKTNKLCHCDIREDLQEEVGVSVLGEW